MVREGVRLIGCHMAATMMEPGAEDFIEGVEIANAEEFLKMALESDLCLFTSICARREKEAAMSKFLFLMGTGPHDPSRQTRCMMIARNAKHQGHEVDIFLTDGAVIFAQKGMADYVVFNGGQRDVRAPGLPHRR